jgi:hypothetical protein
MKPQPILGGVDPYTLTTLSRVLRKDASQGRYTHPGTLRQTGVPRTQVPWETHAERRDTFPLSMQKGL